MIITLSDGWARHSSSSEMLKTVSLDDLYHQPALGCLWMTMKVPKSSIIGEGMPDVYGRKGLLNIGLQPIHESQSIRAESHLNGVAQHKPELLFGSRH